MASKLNLPNSITVARIAVAPVFIYLLFVSPEKTSLQRWLALILFVLAISTDGIDGAIARKRNLVTNLGKLLDPIADKALIGGALVTLSLLGELSWFITAAILIRELGITAYRLIVAKRRVLAASGGGKFKTVIQSIALGFLVSPLDTYFQWLIPVEMVLIYIALFTTIITGLQYVDAELKLRK
ncbi:MAG: CDP-diacylglycerol--glycerol-3-phosphate 3-phosphatidyltransferase [Rhodoluna sp.]|nr:CDP-diacylglycerol--glycerol-3-phosphate 3-phosphatidyltransferase [Rhodoluna sp.]MBP6186343.1 CDP-diacylglycerol--glycerol-3-phosphate 3-phosphatidyltransferase [Rhodoluna sp.]